MCFTGAAPIEAALKAEFEAFLTTTELNVKLTGKLTQEQTLDYVSHGGRMAVTLPVADVASPIADVLINNCVPLLISARYSLVKASCAKDFHGRVLKSIEPAALAEAITDVLTNAVLHSVCNLPQDQQTGENLIGTPAHGNVAKPAAPICASDISVCIAHYCRPDVLDAALNSLVQQSVAGFEVLVVDDGSPDEFQTPLELVIQKYQNLLSLRLIRKRNAYLGASRNTGWRQARGEYVLFMDDDNIAAHNEIELFARAAAFSGDDILTCFSDTFERVSDDNTPVVDTRITPIGGCLPIGAIFNCYGDSNSLWRKAVLEQLGGFTELTGVGKEDNEIFARAVFKGYRLTVLPERLFYYRISKDRMRHHHLNPESGHPSRVEHVSATP